jgi:hypothetical protein
MLPRGCDQQRSCHGNMRSSWVSAPVARASCPQMPPAPSCMQSCTPPAHAVHAGHPCACRPRTLPRAHHHCAPLVHSNLLAARARPSHSLPAHAARARTEPAFAASTRCTRCPRIRFSPAQAVRFYCCKIVQIKPTHPSASNLKELEDWENIQHASKQTNPRSSFPF